MAPLLHTLLRLTAFRSPFLRTLLPSIGLAYTIQAAVAIPSILLGPTERYYDLSGSLTYISCTILSLYLPTLRARAAAAGASGVGSGGAPTAWPSVVASLLGKANAGVNVWNWRQVVLSAAVLIWATRLGTFLFQRISGEAGRDSRFDGLRESPAKFFGAWMAQATWVTLCLMPVLAVNSLTPGMLATRLPGVKVTDILGLAMYAGGIVLEAAADRQKSAWMEEKKEKKHEEGFCTRGLWGWSRHPNYAGEITLWTGIATAAAGVLASRPGLMESGLGLGWSGRIAAMAIAGVSPAFVTFLLTQVSGIPMSETKYDKKFADDKRYQEWKKNTPVLFPWSRKQ